MAVRVVDRFEVVQVHHHQSKRSLRTFPMGDFTLQHVHEILFVPRTGQTVFGHRCVDGVVVLCLDLVSRDELENLAANFDAVTRNQFLVLDLLLIDDGTVVDSRSSNQ